MSVHNDLSLRFATDDDARRLRTLAQLDSAPVPSGPMLIAEIDGRLVAALPLDGGAAIADPFRRSADIVALLRMRAAQLDGDGPASRRPGLHLRRRHDAGTATAGTGRGYALGA
jgi:hypothetical protein